MSVDMDNIELDSILDECLERMQRGEDLESCLTSYPDQGEELRAILIVATDVTKLELPKTGQQATEAGRQRMYAALNNKKITNSQDIQTIPVSFVGILRYLEQVQATIKLNLSKEFLVMHKTVIAIVLVLVMLFGGSAASAYAAQGSLPGDALYPMKTAIENASVDFSMDSASEVRLYLSLAEKRIVEIESLAAEGRYKDMAMAVERFESHIEKAIKGLLVVAQGNPAEAESLATTLGELMERHARVLLALMATAPDNVRATFEDAVEASQEGISAAGEMAGEGTAAKENSSPDEGEEEDNGNLNDSEDEAEEENDNLNGNEEEGNENGADESENENENSDGEDEEGNMNGDDDDEDENVNGDHEEDDDEDENTNGDDDEDENTNGDDDDGENTNSDDDDGENTNGDSDDGEDNSNDNASEDESENANGDEDEANENAGGEEEDGMNENGDESSDDGSSDANDNSSEDDNSNQNDNTGDGEDSSDDSSSNDNDTSDDESNGNNNDADNDNDNSESEGEESENDNSEEDENSNS